MKFVKKKKNMGGPMAPLIEVQQFHFISLADAVLRFSDAHRHYQIGSRLHVLIEWKVATVTLGLGWNLETIVWSIFIFSAF